MSVVVLLNNSSQGTRNTNAVRAHHKRLLTTIYIHKGGAHGFRVFGAQLEHLGNLNATRTLKRSTTMRTEVIGLCRDQIYPVSDSKVATLLSMQEMIIRLISANGPILNIFKSAVRIDGNSFRKVYRSHKATNQASLSQLFFRHKVILTKVLLGLTIVQLMITRNQAHHIIVLLVYQSKSFNRCRCGNTQLLRQILDRIDLRGMHALKHSCTRRLQTNLCSSRLHVCCPAAVVAIYKLCLTCLCQCHELNRRISTNLTRVCNYL